LEQPLDVSVRIGSLTLKNPVTVASGTAGYGEELSVYIDLSKLGAVFTKGLSLKPREGNRGNRIAETSSGMLNSIGLENVGIDRFLSEKLPFLIGKKAVVIPNVAGHTVEENAELCRILSAAEGISALELNVSCPNVKEGGMAFGTNMRIFTGLLDEARKHARRPLIVKLSPNVTDIAEFAAAAEKCGADAVSAVNTYLGMKIDVGKKKPFFNNIVAGLSGPAIKPLALRAVYQIYEKVSIPVIGLGGIASLDDMLEFIMAGASAISIGTMNMINPRLSMELVDGLEEYIRAEKLSSARELVGIAHRGGKA